MITVDLDYYVGDKVFIKELQRPGTILSIWICSKGIKYEVRYFINSEAKEIYFYSHELSSSEEEKKVGFSQ